LPERDFFSSKISPEALSATPSTHCHFLLKRLICANLRTLEAGKEFHSKGQPMKNPLDSILGTIISGLVLTLVLYVFLKNFILAGI
jgi:hypothetical protein